MQPDVIDIVKIVIIFNKNENPSNDLLFNYGFGIMDLATLNRIRLKTFIIYY